MIDNGIDKTSARERARDIVLAVWEQVDKKSWSMNRLFGIYDELASKIQSSALCSDLVVFTENLARKFGVRSLRQLALLDLIRSLDESDQRVVLDSLRMETSFVVLMIREKVEQARERYEQQQPKIDELGGAS